MAGSYPPPVPVVAPETPSNASCPVRIVQITPGAGAMYCGNCLRDNALVIALRRLGHDVIMVPVYLPLTLDEPDQSAANPIFFGGINVYLDQRLPFFSKAPSLVRRALSSRPLLRLASGRAAKTRPEELGELTLSMLQGEEGRQARDLDEMADWLQSQPKPDAVILSNALLMGMARRLKQRLGAKMVCHLGGEDAFLNFLPESHRAGCWRTLGERARELDLLLSPTRYFARLMATELAVPFERMAVVPNGINLEGYEDHRAPSDGPTLGFFTRMSREKGLDLLVRAFIEVRQRGQVPDLKLKIGGSCGPADELLVAELKDELASANLSHDVTWHPNLDRADKIAFFQSLSLFSAPAVYGEAFGLYVIEAMAAGVPVIQPDAASFPEIIEATGGGVLCRPNDPHSLAEEIEELALNPVKANSLSQAGRKAVHEKFSAEAAARQTVVAIQCLQRK